MAELGEGHRRRADPGVLDELPQRDAELLVRAPGVELSRVGQPDDLVDPVDVVALEPGHPPPGWRFGLARCAAGQGLRPDDHGPAHMAMRMITPR